MRAQNAKAADIHVADQKEELATWQYLLASGASKGIASIATYPHEVCLIQRRGDVAHMRQSRRDSGRWISCFGGGAEFGPGLD